MIHITMSPKVMADCSVLTWSHEHLLNNIEKAVSEINRVLIASYDDRKLEYVVFAIENLIAHLEVDSLEEELLSQICVSVEDIFLTTLAGLDSSLRNDIELTQFDSKQATSCLLTLCQRVFFALQSACENLETFKSIPYNKISTFINCLKEILREAHEYFDRNVHVAVELNQFYNDLCNLKSKFWKFIALTVVFNDAEDTEIRYFWSVLQNDARISFTKSRIEIVESWKNFVNFLDKNYFITKRLFDVSDTITQLCRHLVVELNDYEKFVDDSMKSEWQSLKVFNFLLKIIVKICKSNKDNLRNSHTELILLLLSLFRYSPSYLRAVNVSQNDVCEIIRQVTMATEPILSVLCTDLEFPLNLAPIITEHCNTNPYGSIMLLISLLKRITTFRLKDLYFSKAFNILQYIFTSFEKCHCGIIEGVLFAPGSAVNQINLQSDLYEFVFNSSAVFVLTLTPDEFSIAEHTFLANLMQKNPWKAIMVSDLWCLVARYASVDVCHATLDTLISVLNRLDSNSSRPEFTFLRWIVKRLLHFSELEYLDTLLLTYPPEANMVIWRILGLHSPLHTSFLIKNIKTWVNNKQNGIDEYIGLESSLEILANSANLSEPSPSAIDFIPTLWSVEPMNRGLWPNYFCALSAFTAAAAPQLIHHHLLMVIKRCSGLKGRQSLCNEFCTLLILKGLLNAQNQHNSFDQDEINELAELFKNLIISKCPIILTMGLTIFYEYAHNSSFTPMVELVGKSNSQLQNLLVAFFKRQLPCDTIKNDWASIINFEHICFTFKVENCTDHEVSHKRMKLQINDNINDTIDRFEKDCMLIANSQNILDFSQRERIKFLLQPLHKFL